MSSEDPVETTSIEVEGTESQQCRVSIVLNGKLLDDMDFLLSPWPKMDMTVDDTFNLDVEQYDQPPELRLLLDEKQTPAEVRDILLNSLQVPGEEVVSGSQDPNFADDQIQNPKIEEGSGNGESSQSLLRSSSEYQGHSPSTSTTSLSLSTVPTAGSSDDSIRQGSRKPALSALVSSTANFFESVKHAMKDSPTDKKGKSATSRKVESECASCLEEIPTKKMFNLQCRHSYCRECFKTLITTAMQTESLFPPKCCLTEIPLNEVVTALDRNQKDLYKAKAAEYSLKPEARWYCPNASCGKWIPPSKLHRLRMLGAKCPSCDTKICGYCRGMSHETGVDCPEDFGLEATLEEAERQGWRRCYKCRALVELTTGCRHITCKCKAQFCYTCGARWRTCTCNEIDQQRRQAEIAERRNAHAARSREEEEETARTIAAVEAEERAREAEERERREALQRKIEAKERRRREHLERLQAEKKRREEEEATRRLEKAMRTSVAERVTYLQRALLEVQSFQQSSLISRHNSEMTTLTEEAKTKEAIGNIELETLQIKLNSNSAGRQTLLRSEQEIALTELTSKHEEEEDETFVSIQEHLRGKPNREVRLKNVMDKLEQRQKGDMDRLIGEHEAEVRYLEDEVALEKRALEAGYVLRSADQAGEFNDSMTKLGETVMAERKWFEVIAERRRDLIEELERRLWMDIGVELPRRQRQGTIQSKQENNVQSGRREDHKEKSHPSTVTATATAPIPTPTIQALPAEPCRGTTKSEIQELATRIRRQQQQHPDEIEVVRTNTSTQPAAVPSNRPHQRQRLQDDTTSPVTPTITVLPPPTEAQTKTQKTQKKKREKRVRLTTRMDDVMFGSLLF